MTCSIRGLTAFMLLFASFAAFADTDTAELDRMTVTAAKSERPVTEIAAPVTVVDDGEIARTLTESIRDMVRYIPGVTVPFQGQRFGLAGFQIRGLGGNRVQVAVDGVRVPDGFAIGDFSNASRNFVDTDSLKQVEILRGPASSLFGSSALAGVVALTTRDPADWLADSTGDFTVRTRAGFYSADEGWVASGTLAARGERLSGSVQWVERSGGELDNQGNVGGTGPTRTRPNPHEYDGRNLLAKLLLDEGRDRQWRLTLEQNETDSETDVLNLVRSQDFSAVYGMPYIVETASVRGDDGNRRRRISLDYQARQPGWADHFSWKVYHQDARTEQDTFEDRTTIVHGQPSPVHRFRRAEFEQQILGTEATARWAFSTSNVEHDLVGGFEVFETITEQMRDGFERDLTDGSTSTTVGPDDFPVRDFPNSTTLEAGLYLEDRMAFGPRFKLIPGIRVDYYELEPELDRIFVEDNPGFEPAAVEETSVTPRLGAIYALSDRLDLFAQYARGFRSPPYNDVRLPLAAVQRRQRRLHQPAVRLYRDSQPGSRAGRIARLGAGPARPRRLGAFQPGRLQKRLRRLHRKLRQPGRGPRYGLDRLPVAESHRRAHRGHRGGCHARPGQPRVRPGRLPLARRRILVPGRRPVRRRPARQHRTPDRRGRSALAAREAASGYRTDRDGRRRQGRCRRAGRLSLARPPDARPARRLGDQPGHAAAPGPIQSHRPQVLGLVERARPRRGRSRPGPLHATRLQRRREPDLATVRRSGLPCVPGTSVCLTLLIRSGRSSFFIR